MHADNARRDGVGLFQIHDERTAAAATRPRVWLVFYRWPNDYETGDVFVGAYSTEERARAAAQADEGADHSTHYYSCPEYDIREVIIDDDARDARLSP